MKIKNYEKYGAVVVELKGDLVGGPEASEFNLMLHKFLDEGKEHIVVDLGDVKFINSSGIGILISGYTTIKKSGGEMKLAVLPEKLKGVLAITKLNQIFESHKSVDEAVKSFGYGI